MSKIFEQFVDRLDEIRTIPELRAVLIEAGESRGFEMSDYVLFPRDHPQRQPFALGSCPKAWVDRYLGMRYDRIDPFLPRLRTTGLPFVWGTEESLRGVSKAQLQIFDEAREFGINGGLTIPVRGRRGEVASVTFASREGEGSLIRRAKRHRHEMHIIAVHFHERARSMLAFSGSAVPRLTAREIACLRWAAVGKTRWEIAHILSISRRTVAFHLENAQHKLAVHSTTEAVAKAMHFGLVSL